MQGETLAAAFLARLPHVVRDGAATPNLGTDLVDLIARARREAPGVELDPGEFAAYVAERATFDRHGTVVVRPLHAGALWIAFGCVTSHGAAIEAFEREYAPEITNALARSFERALAEDAELRLRERLFLVNDDTAPRLASYSGRGDLRAWLRAAAVRTAIDLMRARKLVPVEPDALGEASAAADPLLAALKERYREEFKLAFDAAVGALTDRERTLLRYRFLDGLSIDEIGVLQRVHRATVARWVAAIRESLFEGTRSRLMAQLSITESDVDSVLRLIDSQLDISIASAIG